MSLIDLRRLGVAGRLVVAGNLALAVVTSLHLGVFETHSAIHYSKPLGLTVAIAGAALALRTRAPAVTPVWMTSILLMLIDRQPSFWHLLVLAPLAVRVLEKGRNRDVLLVFLWIVVVSQLFLRTLVPFPVYWLTMR